MFPLFPCALYCFFSFTHWASVYFATVNFFRTIFEVAVVFFPPLYIYFIFGELHGREYILAAFTKMNMHTATVHFGGGNKIRKPYKTQSNIYVCRIFFVVHRRISCVSIVRFYGLYLPCLTCWACAYIEIYRFFVSVSIFNLQWRDRTKKLAYKIKPSMLGMWQ